MEADVQKLAVTALVGLALMFPVFNQVAASSLEALTNADHKAKWKNFMKGWDDIPEDEKLAYWDGRNRPPGDFDGDRDRLDDDFRMGDPDQPPPQPREGDRDGDGVPDEQDVDPDDPEERAERKARWVTEELWTFRGQGVQSENAAGQTIGEAGRLYQWVNASLTYQGFSGSYLFELTQGDGVSLWDEQAGQNVPLVQASDERGAQNPDYTGPFTIAHRYESIAGPPGSFVVTITGAYKEYYDA